MRFQASQARPKTITFPLFDLLCFFAVEIGHRAAECYRLHLHGRIEGKEDAAPDHALNRRAYNHRAMAAHQGPWMISECVGKRATQRLIADQHVGHARALADLKYRNAGCYERRPVIDRFQRDFADSERNQCRCMRVHDGHDIRPCLVDFAVNESLCVQ